MKAPYAILCGDSRDPACVAKIMDGEKPDLIVTSPPYSDQREYTGEMKGVSWMDLMKGVCAALPWHAETQVFVNLGLVHQSNEWIPYWEPWIEYMRSIGWRRFGWYVWDQGPGLPGDWNGRLAPAFEFIFHFNRKAVQPRKTKECVWGGDFHAPTALRKKDGTVGEWSQKNKPVQDYKIPDSVIRVSRHKARGDECQHPAVFATAMVNELIQAYSDPGSLIFDPFLGSGSTIVSAMQTGRRARGIDVSPAYCDIAVQRLLRQDEKLSAHLADGGATFEQARFGRNLEKQDAVKEEIFAAAQ